jgi:hypothetical protein
MEGSRCRGVGVDGAVVSEVSSGMGWRDTGGLILKDPCALWICHFPCSKGPNVCSRETRGGFVPQIPVCLQ